MYILVLLHVYTCIRYTRDQSACYLSSLIRGNRLYQIKKKKDQRKSVAAMAATAATVPTPLYYNDYHGLLTTLCFMVIQINEYNFLG